MLFLSPSAVIAPLRKSPSFRHFWCRRHLVAIALFVPRYQSRGPGAGRSGNGSIGGAVGPELVGSGGRGVEAHRCMAARCVLRAPLPRHFRPVQRIDVMTPIVNISAIHATSSTRVTGLPTMNASTAVMSSWKAARISDTASTVALLNIAQLPLYGGHFGANCARPWGGRWAC